MKHAEHAQLRLEQLEKRFGPGGPGVGPLSLVLEQGEILGLQGRNGAGKSTLLKVLAGLYRPDRGTVERPSQWERFTAYVPQEIARYDSLSAWDNLRFWGRVYGMPSKILPVRGRWLLEQLDLLDRANDTVGAFSGGMQRRLQLATALMASPQLLLLDEPTAGADPQSVEQILSLLLHLRGQGCTMVLISHHRLELERVCTRILTLDQGMVVEEQRL